MAYEDIISDLAPVERWKCDNTSGSLSAVTESGNDFAIVGTGHTFSQASATPDGLGTSVISAVSGTNKGWTDAAAHASTSPTTIRAISIWAKPTVDIPVGGGYIVTRWSTGVDEYVLALVYVSATTAKLKVFWNDGTNGAKSSVTDAACITKNTWAHIVASYSGGAGADIFVNGVRQTVTDGTDAPSTGGLSRMSVCQDPFANNHLYSFAIDDLMVFNYPLNTPDAAALYNGAYQTYSAVAYANVLDPVVARLRANADPVPFLLIDDSNGNWINDPSNPGTNYGRIGGIYRGLRNLGYPWHGTVPLMPGGDHASGAASEVAQQHANIPWDVTLVDAYGAATGAPAGADAFWNIDGEGTTEHGTAAYNYMMPYRYRYDLADGSRGPAGLPDSAIWLTNGRIWPGAVTIRSTAPIAGHNLRGTYWYVEGPYTGDTPGQINPTARQTSDVKVGSVVDLTAGSYAATSVTLDVDASEYNNAASITFNWGANGAGTVAGSLVTLACRVESRDVPGGFEVGPLFYVGGGTIANAANALANIQDESLEWWFGALFSNQTTPMAVIEIDAAVNGENNGISHQAVIDYTNAIITRIRAVAVTAGADSDNILFILKNSHPVKKTGNRLEESYIEQVYHDYLEVAATAGGCVVVGMHLIHDYDHYIANSWNYSGDTDNHHLSNPTGYDGEAVAVMAALGVQAFGQRETAGDPNRAIVPGLAGDGWSDFGF